MSAAPSPCTDPPSRRPGRLPCAGTVSRCPARRTSGRSPRAVVPARTQVSPASRASTPPARSSASTDAASAASSRDSEGDVHERQGAGREARGEVVGHPTRHACRGCATAAWTSRRSPANQQLVTLHERRVRGGAVELVATFYAPGRRRRRSRGPSAASAARPSSGSTRRRGGGWTSWPRGARCATRLGLPEGRYERSRVCDAILFRRGLPLYPVPAAEQALARWEGWMEVGFDALRRPGPARAVPARTVAGDPPAVEAPGGRRGAALRAAVRDLPRRRLLRPARAPAAGEADALGPAAADRGPAPARRRRRGRRALAPQRRRARRLRRGPARRTRWRRARPAGSATRARA